MKVKKEIVILVIFSLVIVAAMAMSVYQAEQTKLRYDKPLMDKTGGFYLCRVFFGDGHYFVACFDSLEQVQAFMKLGVKK